MYTVKKALQTLQFAMTGQSLLDGSDQNIQSNVKLNHQKSCGVIEICEFLPDSGFKSPQRSVIKLHTQFLFSSLLCFFLKQGHQRLIHSTSERK